MATPDQVNQLNYDDKVSYDFILEAQGVEAADYFLNQKLQQYQLQQQSQQIIQQQEAQKLAEQTGQEAPATVPFQLTPEQQRQAQQSIQQYMQQRGQPRQELPGITGDQEQISMEEVIEMRRLGIPSILDIQTQAEETAASIAQQQQNLGRPSRLGITRTLYDIAQRDWEEKNGPLDDLDPLARQAIEADLRTIAEARSRDWQTAESFAEDVVQGEFGAQRPRQAGSPYEAPPTPRVIPRGIDPTGSVGGEFVIDPTRALQMSGFDAIIESLKPQTLMTRTQMEQQRAQKKQYQDAFIYEVDSRIRDRLLTTPKTPQAMQNERDREIKQMFKDFYHAEKDKLYRELKQKGVSEEAAQQSSDYNAAMKTHAQMGLIPDDNPMYFLVIEELDKEYGLTGALEKSNYAPWAIKKAGETYLMEAGADVLKDLTTEESPFSGELTESIGMTLIRSLNLPFRAVLNPVEEIGEALAGGKSGTKVGYLDPSSGEYKKSFYDVETYDFTEEVSGFWPTMDAYLREIAVENARAYGFGNAIANYSYVPSANDAGMIGGTVAEMLIPWGTIAKGTQKLATTAMPLNKMARGLDLAADANKLTAIGQASGKANILETMTGIKPSATVGYLTSNYTMNNKIAYEVVRQMEAVDAARQYALYMSKGMDDSAAAIAAKMADDPLQKQIFNGLIDGNDFTTLDKLVDDIGRSDSIYGDVAREIRREGRVDLADDAVRSSGNQVAPELGRVGSGGASTDQLVERAAERLAKYNIEDYVALTDRMAVNAEVLNKYLPDLNDQVKALYGMSLEEALNETSGLSAKMVRRDPELRRILDKIDSGRYQAGTGEKLTIASVLDPQEQVYLTNRYVEDSARRALGGDTGARSAAFTQSRPETARAFKPEELRPERGAKPLGSERVERLTRTQGPIEQTINFMEGAGNYVASLTPASATKMAKEAGQKLSLSAPKGVSSELVAVQRAVDRANQSVVRLERALPETMARYGDIAKNPDKAIYAMYRASDEADPTRILQLSDADAQGLVRQLGSEALTEEEALRVFRGLFPALTPADEAILKPLIQDVRSITDLQSIAIQMAEEIPRLKQGMVSTVGIGGTTPDPAKVMIAISGNNAAKQRVAAVARAELSPLSVPAQFRSEKGEKFLYDAAMDYLEQGRLPDDLVLRNRAQGQTGIQIVDTFELRGASPQQAAALRARYMPMDELKDSIYDVANQIRAKGLELNLTPQQVQRQILYSVDEIIEGSGQSIAGVGVKEEMSKLKQLYAEPEAYRNVGSNIEELASKDPGLLNWTQRMLGMTAGDVRRSFVSGQLGGKYLPNVRYSAENIATQTILSSVAAPGANRLLLKPYVSTTQTTASKVRTAARTPEQMNEFLPGSRYTYAQVNDALNRYNLGSSAQSINLGDVALEDIRQEAVRAARKAGVGVPYLDTVATETMETFRYLKDNPGLRTQYSSPGMRFALNTDYYFRENLFIGALRDGKTFDEAAKLAQTAFLDYGALPEWTKKAWFRGALYFSFTYRTAAETAKALANPKAGANIARLARAHQAMARSTGTYEYVGDQTLQSLWITSQEGDGEYDSANVYYRDPWMGQLIAAGNALTFITQAMQGDPEASFSRGLQGILDYTYMPMLDVIQDLDPDFKKGVPPKTMYRILLAQQMSGNIPEIFSYAPDTMESMLPRDATFYIDRYDLEVRPPSKMVPGSPTFDGFQYRFTTKEGYNNFYLDSLALTVVGAKRLADDATSLMIQSGMIPEGAEFKYLENGTPVMYLIGRETPIKVPKEWEMYDRQLRAQQYRLRELKKTFGEPVDTKAGKQK